MLSRLSKTIQGRVEHVEPPSIQLRVLLLRHHELLHLKKNVATIDMIVRHPAGNSKTAAQA
jgi:hypothetical protein